MMLLFENNVVSNIHIINFNRLYSLRWLCQQGAVGHFNRLCSSIALFEGSGNPILWIISALLRFVGNVHVIIKKLGEFSSDIMVQFKEWFLAKGHKEPLFASICAKSMRFITKL